VIPYVLVRELDRLDGKRPAILRCQIDNATSKTVVRRYYLQQCRRNLP
jgi:hypothetical protein